MASAGTPNVSPQTDAQLWSEVDVTVPLTSGVSVTGLGLIRVGDRLPNPTVAAIGGTVDLAVAPGWTLSAGDFWVRARSAASGRALDLQLPLLAVTYARKIHGFVISDRNRVEDILGAPGVSWRYRNPIGISYPVTFGPIRSVFVNDEVFFDFDRNRISRNRAQFGVALKPVGRSQVQLYYLRQDDASTRPGHLNVAGLALIVSLK